MQFGGINMYVKLVLMTIKIQLYFWKKNNHKICHVLYWEKKKCETAFILVKHIYGTV